MRQSNFSRLISRIREESIQRAIDNSPAVIASRFKKSHATHRSFMAKAINDSHSLSKSLTPTKAEIRLKNQKQMQNVRQKLKAAILSKSINSIQAIKLENSANALQAKLYQKDLI